MGTSDLDIKCEVQASRGDEIEETRAPRDQVVSGCVIEKNAWCCKFYYTFGATI